MDGNVNNTPSNRAIMYMYLGLIISNMPCISSRGECDVTRSFQFVDSTS